MGYMNRMNYYLHMLDACIHKHKEDVKASGNCFSTRNYFLGFVSGLKKAKVMFSSFFDGEPVFDHEKYFNKYGEDEFEKIVDEKYYADDLLVLMRYKYNWESEDEWQYSKELYLFTCYKGHCQHAWLHDWDEGQQDVEILGFMKIDNVPFPFYLEEEDEQ